MKVPQARASRRGGKARRWTRLKLYVREILANVPHAERLAILGWRNIRFAIITVRHKWIYVRNILTGNNSTLISVNEIHWINPALIEYCALEEFDIDHYKGCVIGGDWDRLGKRFCDLDIYAAFCDVLSGRCEWHETAFFVRIADELSKGHILWTCRTREDLKRRCQDLEVLYGQIRDNGYMTQQDLAKLDSMDDRTLLDDEITVSIGRQGDPLFSNSAHRLCIAKFLQIESVPVMVAVRHPQWIQHVKMTGCPENICSKNS